MERVIDAGVAAEVSRVMNGSDVVDLLSKSQGFLSGVENARV
jgi:hypothetical protein